MSRRLKIAVMLHAGGDGTAADTPAQARHAERLGLDGIFVGDHLKPAGPYPESVVVLAAAAGVTERIELGFGVMILALRHPAWAAKQVAALLHVSGGVGTGGVMHGTEAWEAVGVPWAERGRRTDEALALLPGLISGETVELPSGASITLSPGAEVPPILVAGNSPAALRRAIRHGAGWFTSMPTPEQIADRARRLPETAPIAVRAVAPLDDETPAQAAERFAAYAEAGATWLVLSTTGDDWHSQWELIAEAATLLPRVHE